MFETATRPLSHPPPKILSWLMQIMTSYAFRVRTTFHAIVGIFKLTSGGIQDHGEDH
jgi:hypothetical protein